MFLIYPSPLVWESAWGGNESRIVSNQALLGGACCWPESCRWETRLSWGLGVGGEQALFEAIA
jgi:hypothetical protein